MLEQLTSYIANSDGFSPELKEGLTKMREQRIQMEGQLAVHKLQDLMKTDSALFERIRWTINRLGGGMMALLEELHSDEQNLDYCRRHLIQHIQQHPEDAPQLQADYPGAFQVHSWSILGGHIGQYVSSTLTAKAKL